MRLKISHITSYSYKESVFIEPHHLYFFPSQRTYFDLKSFNLSVNPETAGLAQRMDAENNLFYQCWFDQMVDHLRIEMIMEVTTRPFNPFDLLVEEAVDVNDVLQLYARKPTNLGIDLQQWIVKKSNHTAGNMLGFLATLCSDMYDQWNHSFNYHPELLEPNITFVQESASCRDLSWLMIAMLRHVAIPARFVSGYSFNPELKGHELHAWVEAWVDGAGWVGLDPSSGLLTSEVYIPIATSYRPENTLPVQGNFRGSSPAEMDTIVEIVPV